MASVAVSAVLAVVNVAVGLQAGSRSVVAVGLEYAGDVLASTVVLIGLRVAARPPDDDHPYGHGRAETLAGLLVGFLLMAAGAGIVVRSLEGRDRLLGAPAASAAWALVAGMAARAVMSATKFRVGRQVGSTSLVADARNDAVDILSAAVALAAVVLSRLDPDRLRLADYYGGAIVGLVVVWTGVRVVHEAAMALSDRMPDPSLVADISRVAGQVPGVRGIEKILARKTGLQHHVDLHLEVDPDLTVRASHDIAHEVKRQVLAELAWVADVLVHVEPAPEERPS